MRFVSAMGCVISWGACTEDFQGIKRPVSFLSVMLFNGVGLMSHHLITVLVQAAAAAEAKSQFLARMSHEIRTPLNGMIAVGQLLAETALSPAQWDLVNTVRCSGETLLTLISDILDFSRIEARLSPDPPGVPAGSTHLPACRGLLAGTSGQVVPSQILVVALWAGVNLAAKDSHKVPHAAGQQDGAVHSALPTVLSH